MCSKDRQEYIKLMFGKQEIPEKTEVISRHKEALEKAHDIRKLEIGLYWQRALYFWGFQVAIFAGLVALVNENDLHPTKLFLCTIFSFLGLITSIAWIYVNKGSKFWQENWELHIDLLEEEITGNLYKNVLSYKEKNSLAFSTSKINYMISKVFSGSWVFIFIFFLYNLSMKICEKFVKWSNFIFSMQNFYFLL